MKISQSAQAGGALTFWQMRRSPPRGGGTELSSGSSRDLSQEGRFLETFKLDSWVEHLRQHERVTHADREQQELVHQFQLADMAKVTHLIAAFRP